MRELADDKTGGEFLEKHRKQKWRPKGRHFCGLNDDLV